MKKKNGHCIYCNSIATTRDHVPPKIFLDPPLINCKTVPSCLECNQKYGKDDEFFAYFVEFLRMIELGFDELEREKIQRVFEHSSSIEDRIFDSLRCANAGKDSFVYIDYEKERIKSYLQRLAVAHIFLEGKRIVSLNSNWTTTWLFARPFPDGFYAVLGQAPEEERKFFRDDTAWNSNSNVNYSYYVDVHEQRVLLKIRDFFFAQVHLNIS